MKMVSIKVSDDQKDALIDVLKCNGIGIATASKWICLCDQKRFGIYDSRVSIALSSVVDEQGFRLFPIVARRHTKERTYPNADYCPPQNMAQCFIYYTDVINELGAIIELSASEVEMAFFMLGK